LPELQSVLRSMDISFHIVFVVAGDDGTRAYIDELGDETVSYVYEWDEPAGLWYAYNLGYRKSLDYNPDVIVSLDGDRNHDPLLLQKMFTLIQEGYDVVVGSRYIDGGGYSDSIDLPVYKVFLSRSVNRALSSILWLAIVDKSSGYRCVRADFVRQIVDEWHPAGFSHQVYLLWLRSFLGARIIEIPQRHRPRQYGESKFPIWMTLWWYVVLCWVIFRRKFFH